MHKNANYKSKKELLVELESEDFRRITLSFYKYVQIGDVQQFRDDLFAALDNLGCKGRIYVASEGINAQMNVPEHNWQAFDNYIQGLSELSDVPYKIAVEQNNKSFIKLIVRIKDKIVAVGLDDSSFGPSDTGEYLTAAEMNDYVANPDAVVVDMRNAYESEIGHFENAVTPNVDTFREELAVITGELADKKDAPIALYCTGGIRCEKASAWMKHNGFKNVRHLQGGIIEYAKQVKETGIENKFLGKNFVFDERMGERIGEEIISTCNLCRKNKSDDYHHCRNRGCHVLFISCQSCLDKKKSYCSYACMSVDALPSGIKKKFVKKPQAGKTGTFRKHRLHTK